MTRLPFLPEFTRLPNTLPVFPLPGALVMPNCELPLNIFEPRYLNMIQDAMHSHQLIGMIQPSLAPSATENQLSATGCAGRVSQYRETQDGRLEIVLTGACRFDLSDELSSTRGYRLFKPDWSRFSDDCEADPDDGATDLDQFYSVIEHFLSQRNMSTGTTRLDQLPWRQLLDSLTCALPLPALDKQVLLETVDARERRQLFTDLLQSQAAENDPGNTPPTRH